MDFLNKKSFHPGTEKNIRAVWIAEQQAVDDAKRREQRAKEFAEEQEIFKNKMLVKGKDRLHIEKKTSLGFMYAAPPGLNEAQQRIKEDKMKKEGNGKDSGSKSDPRFRNAPTEGQYAKREGFKVEPKPFGIEVRHVKCTKCGEWGHQMYDKECRKYNEPLESDANRQSSEDPLSVMKRMESDSSLRMKNHARYMVGVNTNESDHTSLDDEDTALLDMLTPEEKEALLQSLLGETGEAKTSSSKKRSHHHHEKSSSKDKKRHKHEKHHHKHKHREKEKEKSRRKEKERLR